MYFFGRGISAFFNQFFKWLFWNKTGQKVLFTIVIFAIFVAFIRLGEVAAVEEVTDLNYEVKSYYDGVVNEAILRLYRNWDNLSDTQKNYFLGSNNIYFYFGSANGSSYNNAKPVANSGMHFVLISKNTPLTSLATATAYDYMGVTGYTMYYFDSARNIFDLSASGVISSPGSNNTYVPLFVFTYVNDNWVRFIQDVQNNNEEDMIALLTEINENLSNTTPTSDTDSFVEVDSSAVDDVSSASVDNVFSSMTTGFANKFTNYDLSTVNSFVWNLNGTRITFYSDTLYKMIRGTFFETLLSMLWYYIFGHYAFVWLSNIIHKIKDGSILDGLEVNEVITKEML